MGVNIFLGSQAHYWAVKKIGQHALTNVLGADMTFTVTPRPQLGSALAQYKFVNSGVGTSLVSPSWRGETVTWRAGPLAIFWMKKIGQQALTNVGADMTFTVTLTGGAAFGRTTGVPRS